MFFCYIDEAGTSDFNDASTHFVLAGITIPEWKWKTCENDINHIKKKYDLDNTEIHTAWLLRNYHEQDLIQDFNNLTHFQRRSEVERMRKIHLAKLNSDPRLSKSIKQTKKNYEHTKDYIHLTLIERKTYIKELVTCVGKWGFARLFAECIDKIYWNPFLARQTVDEQAFEQIVSRFEQFLEILDATNKTSESGVKIKHYGILIHDNNPTVEKKHTQLMKEFHNKGTLWTEVKNIIETPLFVNSQLTSMIQIADLCCYSIRRYLEKGETELFNEIYKRADRKDDATVGVRHYSESSCKCIICENHRRAESNKLL